MLIAYAGAVAYATDDTAFGNDGIDRSDPNFVTASLLIMSPGNKLYSCAGHSCIRLECPAQDQSSLPGLMMSSEAVTKLGSLRSIPSLPKAVPSVA